MKFLIVFLLASACLGQTITGLTVEEIDDGALKVKYSWSGVSGSTAFTLSAGTTTDADEYGARNSSFSTVSGTTWRTKNGLAPSTKTYFKVTIGSTEGLCTGSCTNCGSGDNALFADGSGANCDGSGDPPWINTAAAGTDVPTAPTHEETDLYSLCTNPDTTLEAGPGDYTTVWATAAAAATDGQVVLVKMAADIYPAERFTLPSTAHANGLVCVEPNVDANLLPHPGAQIAWEYAPHLIVMEDAAPYRNERLADPLLVGEDNWVLRGIWTRPPLQPYEPLTLAVTSVNTSTPSVTLTSGTCPTDLGSTHLLTLDLPGLDAYPGHSVVVSCSSGTITLTGTFTGTYSGGGSVTWGSYIPISSVSGDDPIQVTTTVPHGLPTGNYTGQDWVFIGEVDGETAANGNHYFTVVDSDTIELTGISPTGTYSASDYDFLRYNSGHRSGALIAAADLDDFYVLQSIVGAPNYGQYSLGIAISMGGANTDGAVGIRDSIIHAGATNCPIEPDGSTVNCANVGTNSGGSISLSSSDDRQIINNTFVDVNGINLNAQNVNSGGVVNLSVLRNRFYRSDRLIPDIVDDYFPLAIGTYSVSRHSLMELKSGGDAINIRGNFISGNTAESQQPQGYALFIATSPFTTGEADERHIKDLDIQYNWFTRGVTPIALAGPQQGYNQYNVGTVERLRISNNIFDGDHLKFRPAPSDATVMTKAATGYNGQYIVLSIGGSHLTVKNNIGRNAISAAPAFIRFAGDSWYDCDITKNIFSYHRALAGATQTGGYAWLSGDLSVPNTSFFTVANGFCPSGDHEDNVIIPGLEQAGLAAFETYKNGTNTTQTVTDAEADTDWTGFTSANLVDGSSFQGRFETVFPGDTPEPAIAYNGYGMDYETLLDELGSTRELDVDQTGATTLQFSWHCPTTAAGAVTLSDDDYVTATKQVAVGGSQDQTTTFTGLTVLGTYRAVIACPDGTTLSWGGQLQ